MRWYDSPYVMLVIMLIMILFLGLTNYILFLFLALPPAFYVIYAIYEQPQLVLSPGAAWANQRATRYVNSNNLDAAIKFYSTAIKRNPKFVDPSLNRGLLHMERKEYDAALADFNRVIKLGVKTGEAYAARGQIYALRGDDRRAIADWTHAEGNQSQMVYNLRGDYYIRNGKTFDAHKDFQQAYALNSKDPISVNQFAYSMALVGDPQVALKLAVEAVRLDPFLAAAFNTRGLANYLNRNYEQALADFLKAAELRLNYAFAMVGQAVSYQALGKPREALRVWSFLVRDDPDYASADALAEEYGATGPFLEDVRRVVKMYHEGLPTTADVNQP